MRKLDPVLVIILSEFFINLAAFWFGVAVLGSNLSGLPWLNIAALTGDVVSAIVCLHIAFKLRKIAKEIL